MFAHEDTVDPWRTERERAGSCSVLRVIDLAAGTQEFRVIPWPGRNCTHEDLEQYRLLDGVTLIKTEQALEHEERLAIIRHYDELWREAHATPERARA
jgi:hypothetical protein